MRNFIGSVFLIVMVLLAACGGGDDGNNNNGNNNNNGLPKPQACYSPSNDTALLIGGSIVFSSCSQNSEKFVWKLNGIKVSEAESYTASFPEAGVFRIKLETYNNAGDSSSFWKKITIGYPYISRINVIDINTQAFNKNYPTYTLDISGDDHNHNTWTKTVKGKYKDVTSMPQSFEIPNPDKYRLGTGVWYVDGGIVWQGSAQPVTGVGQFDVISGYNQGKYQFVIQNVAKIEFETIIKPE
ncbi:hypothetical protein GC194_07990 [bacterium]|nr:hypothetical protein [bacterium]